MILEEKAPLGMTERLVILVLLGPWDLPGFLVNKGCLGRWVFLETQVLMV